MEPNHSNNQPLPELPQPQAEFVPPIPEQTAPASPETRGTMMPVGLPQVQQVPQSGQAAPVQPHPAAQPIAMPQAATSQHTAHLTADDADLIEKEWVMRAKAIVMQTADDPNAQNREISKVKADYIKKRYNKDVKLSENQ